MATQQTDPNAQLAAMRRHTQLLADHVMRALSSKADSGSEDLNAFETVTFCTSSEVLQKVTKLNAFELFCVTCACSVGLSQSRNHRRLGHKVVD